MAESTIKAPMKILLYSVLSRTQITDDTTTTRINTYSGRKFSDYSFLIFYLRYNGSETLIRDSKTTNYTFVKVQLACRHGSNLVNYSGMEITKINDTTIDVTLNGDKGIKNLEILGAKMG